MFNNIITFIIVLFIFNISYPESPSEGSLSYTLGMLILTWLVFAYYCRMTFSRLLARVSIGKIEGHVSVRGYQGLILRLSILAIFLFALDVYVFQLKYWFHAIPGLKRFSVLEGTLALLIFLFYLGTIWYTAHPAYRKAFQSDISRRSFIISSVKFNVPILFPWLILSLVYDLISFTPWSGPEGLLNTLEAQILFFACFLIILMVFMPRLVQSWWGCRPFEPSEKVRGLEAFLREKGFRYRSLMKWPIFEGRMMTAGIMGIVPRYRYILITDSLMENLSYEEIKAVTAHEMGHAKYHHLLFYLLFFLGYMVLSVGLFDLLFYFYAANPFFEEMLEGTAAQTFNLYYLALSLPMLISMLIYFRYVMGFFMRHFERQADLYSTVIMGSPMYTINSLEKIALMSGKIRDLPSWHHFSIKERVEYLLRTLKDPLTIKRHNRFVVFSFALYLIGIVGLGYLLNFSPVRKELTYDLIGKALSQRTLKEPNNVSLHLNLAMIYHGTGKNGDAIQTYEKILHLDPDNDMVLNNLAWLLATVTEEKLRDSSRAVILAKRAVSLKKTSVYLDTLAEAYYVNGYIGEAIKVIREAIALANENVGYYRKQLKKFLSHSSLSPELRHQ
ncbi:MAG: M48 family metalloprotease [Pseudomonadota bacterium]